MKHPYEQVSIPPEIVNALLGEHGELRFAEDWSEPMQIKATRMPNGALDLAFRTYSQPVMTAATRERDDKLRGLSRSRSPRAADQ